MRSWEAAFLRLAAVVKILSFDILRLIIAALMVSRLAYKCLLALRL